MADPLSDPRAARLLAADVGEVGSLATVFRSVATQAETTASGLRGAAGDGTWTGEAATAFRAQLGKLPGDLDKVQQSYSEAATALDSYEAQLGPIQSQFRTLATQLTNATSGLGIAQTALTTAQGQLAAASLAPNAKPTSTAVTNAHDAVANAGGAVSQLQTEVTNLQSRGFQLLDEFDTARHQARATVSSAAGIAPSQSWLSGALSSVGNFVEGIGKGIAGAFENIGPALVDFAEHPGWSTFSTLAKDTAVVASIVALAAATLAQPELLGADVELIETAEGVEEVSTAAEGGAAESSGAGTTLRTISDVAGRAATRASVADAVTEARDGKWADAGIDGALAVVPGLGDETTNLLGIGDKSAEAAAAAAEQANDAKILIDAGLTPTAAASLVSDDGVTISSMEGVDLNDKDAVTARASQLTETANTAAATALRVARPIAITIDTVVQDPATDAIKSKVSPEPTPAGKS